MFSVTDTLILPTTVTGSWPRPRWFNAQLGGQALSTRMKDVGFREQYTDALSAMLDDQERAGLDILTHGDFHHDDTVGGSSWLSYPLERLGGLRGEYFRTGPDLPETRPGRILDEVWSSWRWPQVVGRIEPSEETPLEYAKIWRLAQARTRLPVMFGTVSAQQFSLFLDVVDGPYDQDDRRQLIWELAAAMNEELRKVAAAGCRIIQVEEPLLHFVARYQPENTNLIDFLVDAFNREVEGLDDVEVWVHTCWGNPNMQRATEEPSYANAVEIYLERLNIDVWTVEMKDSGGAELELFKPYRDTMRKKIAVGVVSHRDLQVESPDDVAAFTRKALESIPPENLILTSDCGFGRQGSNRLIAFYKAAAIAQGANIVRRELGLPERYVRAADPALQVEGPREGYESRLFGGLVRG